VDLLLWGLWVLAVAQGLKGKQNPGIHGIIRNRYKERYAHAY